MKEMREMKQFFVKVDEMYIFRTYCGSDVFLVTAAVAILHPLSPRTYFGRWRFLRHASSETRSAQVT